MVGLAAVAALVGATTAVTAVALAGGLRPRVIERSDGDAPTSIASTVSTRTVSAIVGGLQRSVVRVEADGDGETRRGAAVVVDEGLLVTSARLVEGNRTVTVRGSGAMVYEADVVGLDGSTGLAVLEVDESLLVPARQAPERPRAGDTAVTMSVSTGGEAEVAMGIVSSVGDAAVGPGGTLRHLITIDRPVPDGSDGAALLDGTGLLIGICLVLDDAGTQGYAVPIEVAEQIADDLRDGGRVRRAWLGVHGVDLPDRSALELGVPGGGLLTDITPGSPGDEAGLLPDDIILSMAGTQVLSINDLATAIADAEPGQKAEVVFLRDGERRTVTVELRAAPAGETSG